MVDQNRLDSDLARRGLARSRSHAAQLIREGVVRVDGVPVAKVSQRVAASARVEVIGDHGYVSRGALKLLAALDAFAVSVTARIALDAGASTGGFSQVLLERGAQRVIAVDVGHGQLDASLVEDHRLLSCEGVNVRALTTDQLAGLVGEPVRPDLVVADLSFISLTQVIAALREVAQPFADFVLLVKPQFEVGRGGIREGIVRDARLRREALSAVLWAGFDVGLGVAGVIPSPIAGSHGNREYLVHLSERGENPGDWLDTVDHITAAG